MSGRGVLRDRSTEERRERQNLPKTHKAASSSTKGREKGNRRDGNPDTPSSLPALTLSANKSLSAALTVSSAHLVKPRLRSTTHEVPSATFSRERAGTAGGI